MAHETGTATDYDDLLTKLVSFLTTNADLVALNQNWVVEKEEIVPTYNMSGVNNTTYSGDFRDVYLRGPGLSATDRIHVNIRQYQNNLTSLYGWMLAGATDFNTGLAYEYQTDLSKVGTIMPIYMLANVGTEYHFIATGRWFMVVAIIGGESYLCYCGYLLPYARPSEYGYPLLILGNALSLSTNIESDRLDNFYNSDNLHQQIRLPDGSWHTINKTRPIINGSSTIVGLWPSTIMYGWDFQPTSNADGSFTLLPQIAYTSGILGDNVLGEIESVYYIPKTNLSGGSDLTVNDTITIDGDTYLVVQNGKKTTENDYAAIKLV